MSRSRQILSQLLEEYGCVLIEEPLRIDAFLRDLAPEEAKEIFALVEVMESGVLDAMRDQKPELDSELQGYSARLTAQSGIVPNLAFWAVQQWAELLPPEAFGTMEIDVEEEEEHLSWVGSIEDVLGIFRDN